MTIVFLACVFTAPPLLSRLEIDRFKAGDTARLYVAIAGAGGVELDGVQLPLTLPETPFVGAWDKASVVDGVVVPAAFAWCRPMPRAP